MCTGAVLWKRHISCRTQSTPALEHSRVWSSPRKSSTRLFGYVHAADRQLIVANPGRREKYEQCGEHRARPCRRLYTAMSEVPVRVCLISCRVGLGLDKFSERKPRRRSRVSAAQRFGCFFKEVTCNLFRVTRGRGGPADLH